MSSRLAKHFPGFFMSPFEFAIADSAITTAKLSDSAVTNAKLADSSVDSSKLQDCAVTYSAIQNVTAARLLGRYDALAGVVQEITLGGGLTFDSATGVISSDTTISYTITDSQVDSSALADSAVSSLGIQDGSIVSVDLADSAVDSSKLADSAVSSAGIQDGSILGTDIADSTITYAKIQNVTAARLLGRHDALAGVVQEITLAGGLTFDSNTGTISSDTTIAVALSDSQVDSGALADSAVSSAGIQDGTIVEADLADSAVTNAKLADSAVDSGSIADSAVTSAGLADSAVMTAKISDSQVTYAKVQAVTAARLLGRYDATAAGVIQEITLAGGLTFDSTAGTLSSDTTIALSSGQVDSSALADSAVSSAGIQDATIVAADFADSAVATAKIDALAVTSAKLGDTSVTTGKINDDAVTLAKMAAGTAGNLIAFDASGNPAAVATGTATHVLTSNGAGAAPTFQVIPAPTLAEDQLRIATISLSAANINSMFTTPIQLIAAPGAGKAILLEEAFYSFTYGGTQFTGGGTLRVQYNGATQGIIQDNPLATQLQAAANFAEYYLGGLSGAEVDVLANAAVMQTNASADFATGNGTMKVFVKYRIVTL